MEDFKEQVKKGFNKCKLDISELFHENKKLKEGLSYLVDDNSALKDEVGKLTSQNENLTQKINSLTNHITQMQSELKGINIALEYIKNISVNQVSPQVQPQQSTSYAVQSQQTQQPHSQVHNDLTSSVDSSKLQDNLVQSKNVESVEQSLYESAQTSVSNKRPLPQRAVPEQAKDPYEALLSYKAKANKREILKQKMLSMIGENGLAISELKFLFVDHFKYCSKATFYNYLKEIELEKYVKVEREGGKNYIYLSSKLANKMFDR